MRIGMKEAVLEDHFQNGIRPPCRKRLHVQPGLGHGRQHLLDEQVDVGFAPIAVLGREVVRAEEGARRRLLQLPLLLVVLALHRRQVALDVAQALHRGALALGAAELDKFDAGPLRQDDFIKVSGRDGSRMINPELKCEPAVGASGAGPSDLSQACACKHLIIDRLWPIAASAIIIMQNIYLVIYCMIVP